MIVLIGFILVVLLFGGALLVGPPFLPTLRKQSLLAIDLLDLKEGDTFYELGCGDGRLLKLAAKSGATCIGVEINPIMVLISKINCWGQRNNVKVLWANFWSVDLQSADAIYIFGLKKIMGRLNNKIIQENHKNLTIVSFAFELPKAKPVSVKAGLFKYKFNNK